MTSEIETDIISVERVKEYIEVPSEVQAKFLKLYEGPTHVDTHYMWNSKFYIQEGFGLFKQFGD